MTVIKAFVWIFITDKIINCFLQVEIFINVFIYVVMIVYDYVFPLICI